MGKEGKEGSRNSDHSQATQRQGWGPDHRQTGFPSPGDPSNQVERCWPCHTFPWWHLVSLSFDFSIYNTGELLTLF